MPQYEVIVREVTVKVYYTEANSEQDARNLAADANPSDFYESREGSTWEVEEVNLLPGGETEPPRDS